MRSVAQACSSCVRDVWHDGDGRADLPMGGQAKRQVVTDLMKLLIVLSKNTQYNE